MVPLRTIRSLRDFHRIASECVYEAWRSQSPSLRRFCLATQRALFANLLLFRHSGSLVCRRINDRYWSFHNSFLKELRTLQAQRILLGGCILSFAQDKITDEELMNTIKNFTTSPERVPKLPETVPSNSEGTMCAEVNTQSEAMVPPETLLDKPSSETTGSHDRFTNPPLTVLVRQLRKELSELTLEFWQSRRYLSKAPANASEVQSSDPSISSGIIPTPEVPAVDNTVDTYFSTALSSVTFHPDGTGFVDDTWELIVNRRDLRIWRRPIESAQLVRARMATTSGTNNTTLSDRVSPPAPTAKYEYRLCGTMADVSALSFLEVQLNLNYRTHWDDRVVTLDYLHPANPEDGSAADVKSDLIRWVARFPFPMAQREYVYARRWWLQTTSEAPASTTAENSDPTSGLIQSCTNPSDVVISYGQHAVVLSRSCLLSDKAVASDGEQSSVMSTPTESDRTKSWAQRLKPCTVAVTSYRSEMLIQAHSRFDELGMNYYLIYYDDPRLPVGDSAFNLVSGKAMNQFISQLHSAALALHRSGLPSGVDPIVFRPRTAGATVHQSPSTGPVDRRPDQPTQDSELPSTTTSAKPKFFADYGPETSHNISTVVY